MHNERLPSRSFETPNRPVPRRLLHDDAALESVGGAVEAMGLFGVELEALGLLEVDGEEAGLDRASGVDVAGLEAGDAAGADHGRVWRVVVLVARGLHDLGDLDVDGGGAIDLLDAGGGWSVGGCVGRSLRAARAAGGEEGHAEGGAGELGGTEAGGALHAATIGAAWRRW